MAHSNESEWQNFKNNKNNEAFIDRIYVIKVPYCLRATEERQIYEKLLRGSELGQSPCAPGTLDMLARFCVLSRFASMRLPTFIPRCGGMTAKACGRSIPGRRACRSIRTRLVWQLVWWACRPVSAPRDRKRTRRH